MSDSFGSIGLNWTTADLRRVIDEARRENLIPDVTKVKVSPSEHVPYSEVFDRMANDSRGGYLRRGAKADIGERIASDIKVNNIILPQYNDKFEDRDEEVNVDHQIRRYLREDIKLIRHAENLLIHDARICRMQKLIQIPSLLLELDVVDVCTPDAGACTVINDPARKYPGKGRALLPPAFKDSQKVPYVYDVLIIESSKCADKIRGYRSTGHVGTSTLIYGSIDGNWERYTCDGEIVPKFDVSQLEQCTSLEIGTLADLPDVVEEPTDVLEDGVIDDIRAWVEEEKEEDRFRVDGVEIVHVTDMVRDSIIADRAGDEFNRSLPVKVEMLEVDDLSAHVLARKNTDETNMAARAQSVVDYVEGRSAPPLIPVVREIHWSGVPGASSFEMERSGHWEPVPPDLQLATVTVGVTGRFLGLGEFGQCLGAHSLWSCIPYGRQGLLEIRGMVAYLFLLEDRGDIMDHQVQAFTCRYRVRLRSDPGYCRARCVLSGKDGSVHVYELLDHSMVGDRTAFMKRYAILDDMIGLRALQSWSPWVVTRWHECLASVASFGSCESLVHVRFDTPRNYNFTVFAVVPPSSLKQVCRGNRIIGPKSVARQWGISERTNKRWKHIINKYEVLAAVKFDSSQRFLGWPRESFASRFVSLAYLHYLWFDRPKRQSSFRRAMIRGVANPYGEFLRHRDRSFVDSK